MVLNQYTSIRIPVHIMSYYIAVSGHYCLAESFDVTCPQGHVILMERALFGRMASGRCISEVHLGCSHNVLPYLDNHCTGHRRCNIDVNALVKVAEPCNRDYKSYLDAAYQCVPGWYSYYDTRSVVDVD